MWSNVQLKDGTTIGIGIDISEKKSIEDLLKRKARLESLGTLAGGIAHNFNNCLAAIMGFSEIALEKINIGERCQEDLHEVLKAGNRATALVRQIVMFCGNIPHETEPIRVNQSAQEVVSLLRSTTPSYIDIELIPCKGDPILIMEDAQLYQVLMNICTNAVHAMMDEGDMLKIKIETVQSDQSIVKKIRDIKSDVLLKIEISDTGTGIEEAHLDRLFDPYFSTKEMSEGGGLGLAVVHGIITSHHGEIIVESTPGKGAVFTVYFPFKNDELVKSPIAIRFPNWPQTDENCIRA